MINDTYPLILCHNLFSMNFYEFKEFNNIKFQTKINLLFLLHIVIMEKNITLQNLYSFTVKFGATDRLK